jgi:RNA polymerase sigma factor (sigma-70 family)
MSELTAERLARRAATGDERAFATIFRRYHQRLYRYCLAILGEPQDAQDALQNTMVKALRALPGEERNVDLKPWLYRVAHNESIDMLRRRRETAPLDAEQAAVGPGLAEEAAARERLRKLISDLDQLPERQRGVLLMRELAGLEFAEIGTALDTSAAVARQALYEARASLRQMDEGREMSCQTVTRALSDGDGRVTRRRDIRAHLRTCESCRRFGEEIDQRRRALAALSPLPAVAAAGLLQGLLGGSGPGGGGLAALFGGGAAKAAGASAALKGAAAVAVVAAIGVTAADRSGLIDVAPSGGGAATISREAAGTPAANSPQAGVAGNRNSAGGRAGSDGGVASGGVARKAPADVASGTGGGAVAGHPGAEAVSTPTTEGSGHAHGQGHAKSLPGASGHGQETAATHKTEGKGVAGHPEHPDHPSHPVQAAQPAAPQSDAHSENEPAGAAAPGVAAEEHSQGGSHAAPAGPPPDASP